ncbi:hypothetical protein GCM10018790_43700 [Kitasatospora xanthocidica]|nr:hypothetical protein GCM10018790_43700 [Kitasatospora xanthocidica]
MWKPWPGPSSGRNSYAESASAQVYAGKRTLRAGKRGRCAVPVKGRCPRWAAPAALGTVGGTPGPSGPTEAAAGGLGSAGGAGDSVGGPVQGRRARSAAPE